MGKTGVVKRSKDHHAIISNEETLAKKRKSGKCPTVSVATHKSSVDVSDDNFSDGEEATGHDTSQDTIEDTTNHVEEDNAVQINVFVGKLTKREKREICDNPQFQDLLKQLLSISDDEDGEAPRNCNTRDTRCNSTAVERTFERAELVPHDSEAEEDQDNEPAIDRGPARVIEQASNRTGNILLEAEKYKAQIVAPKEKPAALDKIWFIGDDFASRSFDAYFKQPEGSTLDCYVLNNYNVSGFFKNKFTSNNPNMVCRVINEFTRAIREQPLLPKYLVIVPDDDLIKYLNFYDFGVLEALGKLISYLMTEIDRMISSQRDYLPKKCKRYNMPAIIWIEALLHHNFNNNNIREKFNASLHKMVNFHSNTYILQLKKGWDSSDRCLYLAESRRFTNKGLTRYWNAVDKTVKYVDTILIKKIKKKEKQQQSVTYQYDRYHWQGDHGHGDRERRHRNQGPRMRPLPRPPPERVTRKY